MSTDFKTKEYFDLIAKTALKFKESKEYLQAVEILFDCWEEGGVVFTMGCGGSASTATHFAADLAKTTKPRYKVRPGFKTVALTDNIPLTSAWINELKPWLTDKDVLVGFSVHGGSGKGNAGPWSQNLVKAVELAQERRARVVGFSGFDGGMLKKMSDVCLTVPIDQEPYGTPAVEAMHVVLHHGLIFDLKKRIADA